MLLTYVVAPGDTLFTIATRFGVTLAELQAVNRLPNPDDLVVGQALIIPTTALTYTVRPGDTLFGISQLFGIPLETLIAANRIADPDLIFPGQRLTVPGYEALLYTVRPGETLFRLAQRFGVPLDLLARANDIADPNLILAGQRLTVPIRGVLRRPLTTNGFIFPTSLTAARNLLAPIADLLTYISIFDFPVDGGGGVVAPAYGPVVQAALERGIASLPTLTNFTGGNFDPDLARAVLADPAVRQSTIDRYLQIVQEGGFAGAMVDFENMYPVDRPLYTQFIAEISRRVRSLGLVMFIAVAPKWADFPNAPWVGAFDYAALGQLVDFMYIMTYEWGWVGGPPGPVAPVNLVRRVLEYAAGLVPSARIMQGIPLYGYDWPLPDTPETLATTVDPQQALVLAAARGAAIQFDPVAQVPNFTYTDAAGAGHVVWFEDARSVRAKYEATRDFGLGGAGFWQLFNDFPQNWEVLRELFEVRKVAAR
ncbi:MAG: glycoside hydrolase family 18 protein [Bacteroidota bacterium]